MKVRSWVFETNSSSVHSFSFVGEPEYWTITPDDRGVIALSFWEFGWWFEVYETPESIASYIATGLFNRDASLADMKAFDSNLYIYDWDSEDIKRFEEAIKEHTWAKVIAYTYDPKSRDPFWYIDHQSEDLYLDMMQDMKESIFRKGELIITSDN